MGTRQGRLAPGRAPLGAIGAALLFAACASAARPSDGAPAGSTGSAGAAGFGGTDVSAADAPADRHGAAADAATGADSAVTDAASGTDRDAGGPSKPHQLGWGPTIKTGLDLYVTTTGSDANPGTIDKPFATPEPARDAIRVLRATVAGLPAGGVTVWFRQGTYIRNTPFQLASQDSGTPDKPIL